MPRRKRRRDSSTVRQVRLIRSFSAHVLKLIYLPDQCYNTVRTCLYMSYIVSTMAQSGQQFAEKYIECTRCSEQSKTLKKHTYFNSYAASTVFLPARDND